MTRGAQPVIRLAAIVMSLGAIVAASAQQNLPAHPDEIAFPPLTFEPPSAESFRHQLSNGVSVYLAPSAEFPLIDVSFTFKGGSYLDPPGSVGLAAATGAMIRRGGTTARSPEELDEALDFLAAEAFSFCGDTQSGASLNCLTENFDESFAIFLEMLRQPGLDESRLIVYRQEELESMKQRNDRPGAILGREWRALVYGRDHFEAALSTEASINGITVEGLRTMHGRIFHPGNLIIAVSGDFETGAMLDHLEQAISGWTAHARVDDPPAPVAILKPGVYAIEKDIPQGRVRIGLRSIKRDDPDYFPLLMMNDILGGGGFTSRITQRVRSDEGLAYSAGSRLTPRVHYAGELNAGFESKSRTVALATKIVLEELERVRNDPVDDEELETAQQALIERFPRAFESKERMLGIFVEDELTGRDSNYWRTYRDNVRAVTKQDILDVANRHVRPDQVAILIVGKWDEIYPGDLEGRATMSEFFNGEVTHMPLRDPLTQEEME